MIMHLLSGGDEPRPYDKFSGVSVGAGFMPARAQSPKPPGRGYHALAAQLCYYTTISPKTKAAGAIC